MQSGGSDARPQHQRRHRRSRRQRLPPEVSRVCNGQAAAAVARQLHRQHLRLPWRCLMGWTQYGLSRSLQTCKQMFSHSTLQGSTNKTQKQQQPPTEIKAPQPQQHHAVAHQVQPCHLRPPPKLTHHPNPRLAVAAVVVQQRVRVRVRVQAPGRGEWILL